MKPLLTAVFKVDGRVFIELPGSVAKLANVRPGSLLVPRVEPDGGIVLRQAEAEGDKT